MYNQFNQNNMKRIVLLLFMVLPVYGNAQIPWPVVIKGIGYVSTAKGAYDIIDAGLTYINHTKHESEIKKGLVYYHDGYYEKAFANFNEVDSDDKDIARVMAHYYKALCRYKQKNFEKAMINVNRTIKFNDYDLISSDKEEIQKYKKWAADLKKKIEEAQVIDKAEKGDVNSQLSLLHYYEKNKDHKQTFYWAKKAADNKNPEGQYELGMCYLRGKGVDKDTKSAVRYFKLSAEKGFADAQYRLAACLEQGVGIDRDKDKAKEWLNKAVKQNNVDAISYLGRCYYNGTLMTQDYKMAVKYFQKVADTDSKAQFFLGECYRLGHGVKKDTKLSLDWFKKASAQGHSGAQVKIGEYYLDQQKNKEAFDYFSKAAKAGDVDGLFYLGLCHEKGIGVKKDMTTAKSWYQKAANKGSDKAKKKLANLK